MNYADIKYIDVANGPGIRVSLFVSGCTHHCKGCFNQETWDFNFGQLFTEEQIDEIIKYLEPNHIKGLSLLGGEPFEYSNQQGLLPLLRRFKECYPDKDVWCYTGYLFDKDIQEKMMVKWPETREIINYIDILVDGEFKEDLKDLKLRFKGSSNQRIIDVKKSLETNSIVLWEGEVQ
ncbi:MAG: anaerobic ribonucleoside-triphosphate reductase activating protein [Wujia sp.]